MIIFTDSEGRIKDVNTTIDSSLIRHELEDEGNPFVGWSREKICCYKVAVSDGRIVMMPPYIDSRLLDTVGHIGSSMELDEEDNNNADFELADLADENNNSIFDLAEYVAELEARIEALEGGE